MNQRTWLAVAASVAAACLQACGSASVGSSIDAGSYNGSPSVSGGADGGGYYASADAAGYAPGQGANTNVSLSGSGDFGYFRRLLDSGQVPRPEQDFEAAGFFAEHHSQLPQPVCGERICLQALLGVMGNLSDGSNCTMLQIGLNSPLVADPSNRPPLNLSVVVDVSGSMAEAGKIDFVRQGLQEMVDGLRDTDQMALIVYSDDARLLFPMQEVKLQRSELRELVSGLGPEGGTNFHAGLQLGYQEALRSYDSGRQNRVIMLSDGQPTSGVTDEAQIIELSRGYNSDGIGLTTIGLGTGFNANLMRTLAQQADGNFYFVEDAGAVSEVFGQELSYFTVPVAFDLQVEVRGGDAYLFNRAYGSPFWKSEGNGGSLSVPSVFLAHRESDEDQTPAGGRRGGGSALLLELQPRLQSDDGSGVTSASVATVAVSFREPGTNRIVEDEVVVDYPFAPWNVQAHGYFDSPDVAAVQKSFVMLNLYRGIEIACQSFHDRQGTEEIVARLRRLVAAVADYNQEIEDQDIAADLELVDQLIHVLIQNGVPDPDAPPIPEDPWPAD